MLPPIFCMLFAYWSVLGGCFFTSNIALPNRMIRNHIAVKNIPSSNVRHHSWFGMTTEDSADVVPAYDFSQYSIGKQFEGSLLSSKNFGFFVDIGTGTNVLIPKSQTSKNSADKLQALVDAKSQDKIRIELVTVSAENRTLSGKYVTEQRNRVDLSLIQAGPKFYKSTVVSVHDFGLFARIEEFGVDGLIPISKLPTTVTKSNIKGQFPVGTAMSVKIDSVNTEGKKISLSMESQRRGDVSSFAKYSKEKWVQGAIESVTKVGLFVRLAGSDSTGLVYFKRVPVELISALKKLSPIPAESKEKTDVENLLSKGDIVRVRVNSVDVENNKLELSMLPFLADDKDEEDFATADANSSGIEQKEPETIDSVDEEYDASYNPQSTLVWWRGAPYAPEVVEHQESSAPRDEELEILSESAAVIEGTWRRMFEVSMREDEADFSSKLMEAEMKELEEDIGELKGLDDDIIESMGGGVSFVGQRFGSFIPAASLPAEWREQMAFFKDLEISDGSKNAHLKRGKKSEQLEFDSLVREIEADIERSSQAKSRRSQAAPAAAGGEFTVESAVHTAEVVAVVQEEAAVSIEVDPVAPAAL